MCHKWTGVIDGNSIVIREGEIFRSHGSYAGDHEVRIVAIDCAAETVSYESRGKVWTESAWDIRSMIHRGSDHFLGEAWEKVAS